MVEGEWDVVVVFPVSGPLIFLLPPPFFFLEKGVRRDILLFHCSLHFEKKISNERKG